MKLTPYIFNSFRALERSSKYLITNDEFDMPKIKCAHLNT